MGKVGGEGKKKRKGVESYIPPPGAVMPGIHVGGARLL
jgi:hypothetical protein